MVSVMSGVTLGPLRRTTGWRRRTGGGDERTDEDDTS